MRRTCVWQGQNGAANYTNGNQNCGGYLLDIPNGLEAGPWMRADGSQLEKNGKGFLCPKGSLCVEADNPSNGTVSFDNILQSLELVFVIMSSNTWSTLLYQMADTDYLVSSLFFIVGIIVLSLWLISLLIAVITSSFQIIREESKTSAFTGEVIKEESTENGNEKKRVSSLKRFYDRTSWIWVVVIAFGLVSQMMKSASMSPSRTRFIERAETIITFILLFEIMLRFVVDWRHFFRSKRNVTDLFIAIITTVIQIPAVKSANGGKAYAWLTIFQIIRIYRVVLAVPVTRDLVVSLIQYRKPNGANYDRWLFSVTSAVCSI